MSETKTKQKREAVKAVDGATLFNDGTILVKNVRFSHPHIFKEGMFEGKPSGYGVTAMIPKGRTAVKKLLDEAVEKTRAEAKIKVAGDKIALKDGDDSDKDEYAGHWTLSAREKKRPVARNARNEAVTADDDPDLFYGGCWGNVLVRPWAQNNSWGKRINFNFLAAQFVKDGEPFGEGRISEDEISDTFESEDDEV